MENKNLENGMEGETNTSETYKTTIGDWIPCGYGFVKTFNQIRRKESNILSRPNLAYVRELYQGGTLVAGVAGLLKLLG